MPVYLDNAATTPPLPEVIQRMQETMGLHYGNPSSIHASGRKARALIEQARRTIAKELHCRSTEIFFTGSGSEADNMALRSAVRDLGVKTIITSAIEHKAVLDTAERLQRESGIRMELVRLQPDGRAELEHLRSLCEQQPGALVSLMHANNEIGSLNDLEAISAICREYGCYLHSDTVQTMAHYRFDLQELDIDFITCSAHKFHGPKGVGFLYRRSGIKTGPIISGGSQESGLRAGTENSYGIAGMETAFELAYASLEADAAQIASVKQYCLDQLRQLDPRIEVNGAAPGETSLYTVLNVSIPPFPGDASLLFQLDLKGIYVSGGSACNSGALKGSHVLEGIGHPEDHSALRFSFSKFSTREEIDEAIEALREIMKK